MIDQILNSLLPALTTALSALITPNMVLVILATLAVVQVIKWISVYWIKSPHRLVMWLVVSPLVAIPIALGIMTDQKWFYRVVAGLVASFAANLFYRYIIKAPLEKTMPKVYHKLNVPVDRRKKFRGRYLKEELRR